MVQLVVPDNVRLKPCQRRRLLAVLRRCTQLGKLIGDCRLVVWLARTGRSVEARARLRHRAGQAECHARGRDWRDAVARLVRRLYDQVHAQRRVVAVGR